MKGNAVLCRLSALLPKLHECNIGTLVTHLIWLNIVFFMEKNSSFRIFFLSLHQRNKNCCYMRKIVVLILYFTICAVFSACSKDDSKSAEGGGNNNPADVVSTGDAEYGMTYVIIKGIVNLSVLNIGNSSIEYGAEVSISENFTNSKKNTTRNIEGNLLKIKINNLTSNAKYYYRAFLKTNGNTYYGKPKSFTTKELINVTTTGSANNITLSSAVASCDVNLTTLDSKESYKLGIAYSLSKDISKKDNIVESYVNSQNANEGQYSTNIRGLQPATTYYYCSYTSDGENYIFGETKFFTTLSNNTFEYLNTSEAVDVSGRSATLQGWSKLESLYNGNSIRYFFDYSDDYNIVANRSQHTQQTEAHINSGNLSAHISSLSENTKYYYRIVAEENNTIVAEGEILSFTTTPYEAPEGYYLVWQDEFDSGTELNQTEWTHEVQSSGWVNNELQNYVNHKSPKGSLVTEIDNGVLRINCFKEDGKVYSGRVYAHQKEGWQYGYIEASIKLPKGKGTWPAFWMMPVNFKSWPDDGEIDIMEEVGYNPNYVSSSLHSKSHSHLNNTQLTHEMKCNGAEGEFHIYAIEWTAKNITTYVDGKLQLSYDNRGLGHDDWPYDNPFYIIFNLAWGGSWGGAQGVDESALPVTMEVDYIRVFQKK